ncbi:MAG: hypothetical protein K6B65_04895 [Bacilli bacterium]|nr:hypothetical protein [Bacilli bacterium]
MPITWFSLKEKVGTASFYGTNITLNTIASIPFADAYRVQVGLDESGNVVIQPLSKDRVIRGDLDEYAIQTIAVKKTYSRISSTPLMKQVGEALGIELSDSPKKYETTWDEKENILTIHTGKEKAK